jgi:hypothetical protein
MVRPVVRASRAGESPARRNSMAILARIITGGSAAKLPQALTIVNDQA